MGLAVEALRTARGGPEFLAECAPALAAALEAPEATDQHALVLGTYAGAPVGVALVVRDRLGTEAVARLLLCYVEPEAREVGVGRALLEAVTEWARAHGCQALEAPALPGDRATKRLLEASGHRARLVLMHRSLDAGAHDS